MPMKKTLFFLFIAAAACTSCKDKKVIVFSKGPAKINTDAKTISAGDEGSHEDATVTVSGGGKTSFELSSPAGKTSVDLEGDGVFVINVKNDTLIGSYQSYGNPAESGHYFSQDDVKRSLDSLKQLVQGKNISEANRNFFLLPNHAARITGNKDAVIISPFHQLTTLEKVDGKEPEVYQFFSIGEIRENIEKLQKMTEAPKQ